MNFERSEYLMKRIQHVLDTWRSFGKLENEERALATRHLNELIEIFGADISHNSTIAIKDPLPVEPVNPEKTEVREEKVTKVSAPTPVVSTVADKETEELEKKTTPKKEERPQEQKPVAPKKKEVAVDSASDEKISALFDIEKSGDLGDKLKMQPIKKLETSFSINERILTINELFGGDNAAFTDAIKQFDSLTNLEEAKPLLTSLAEKFDWLSDEKFKKAKRFGELIVRRYS